MSKNSFILFRKGGWGLQYYSLCLLTAKVKSFSLTLSWKCIPTWACCDCTACLFLVLVKIMKKKMWTLMIKDVCLNNYMFLQMRWDICSFVCWYLELISAANQTMGAFSHLSCPSQCDEQQIVCATNTNSTEASATCSHSRCDREKAFDKAHSISGKPLGFVSLLSYSLSHQSWSC